MFVFADFDKRASYHAVSFIVRHLLFYKLSVRVSVRAFVLDLRGLVIFPTGCRLRFASLILFLLFRSLVLNAPVHRLSAGTVSVRTFSSSASEFQARTH